MYKLKKGPSKIESVKYMARVVAQGFSQREGVDYNEVFSLVVKYSSIKILFSLITHYDLHLEQMEAKNTFLLGELDETTYKRHPKGFDGKGKEDHMFLLKRSLCGLKQSPRLWNKRFDQFMLKLSYKRCVFDAYVYYKKADTGNMVYFLLYVDDMLSACKSLSGLYKLKEILKCEFKMKDLGEAKKILGMEICRDRVKGELKLSQKEYVESVLQRLGMENAMPVRTPLAVQFKLSSMQSPLTKVKKKGINGKHSLFHCSWKFDICYDWNLARPSILC